MKVLVSLCAVILTAYAAAPNLGYTKAINGATARECQPGMFFADENNMCWYWACVRINEVEYELQSRECAVGTRISYSFEKGLSLPCTHNYNRRHWLECSREFHTLPVDRPFCTTTMKCQNGGELQYSGGSNSCWCTCPPEWQGDSDCSKRTRKVPNAIAPRSKCLDGKPDQDHCTRVGGCLNGGTCTNLCGDFSCKCVWPYRWGKRCERFDCERNGECKNGGTCTRGTLGLDEFRNCQCPPRYTGFRCERFDCRSDGECFNGGTCVTRFDVESYQSCLCPRQYMGSRCEEIRPQYKAQQEAERRRAAELARLAQG